VGSALRNLGGIDVAVTVSATTDRGEQLRTDVTVPREILRRLVLKPPQGRQG